MTTPPREAVREENGVLMSQPCGLEPAARSSGLDAEPSEASVHRVCALVEWKDGCKNCPRTEDIDGEAFLRSCYLHARESVNTVETGNPWRKTGDVRAPFVSAQTPSANDASRESPSVSQDEPESSQNLLQARIKEPFERHPALASWIERLGNTQMELPLGDWMVFIGALNLALSASEARAQKAEGELERMREALMETVAEIRLATDGELLAEQDKDQDALDELFERASKRLRALLPSDQSSTQSSTS